MQGDKMTTGFRYRKAIWGLLAFIFFLGVTTPAAETPPLTLVMAHPTPGQIRNIVALRAAGLLSAEPFRLIGVFHEDENTDYAPSRKLVETERLDWVEFVVIRGPENRDDAVAGGGWEPDFQRLFARSHGILFTGGSDLLPSTYGQSHLLLTDADNPARNRFELSFMRYLVGDPRREDRQSRLESETDFPVLAVCLGAQTLNVALGGTLWQDIPFQVYGVRTAEEVLALGPDRVHSSRYLAMLNPGVDDLLPAFHFIRWLDEGDWLQRLPAAARPVAILSNHHQAIAEVAADLVVVARSLDGRVVEAVAHRRYSNVLGVQFHPEVAALYQAHPLFRPAPGEEPGLSLAQVLSRRPGSRRFHEQLWRWFSSAMQNTRRRRLSDPDPAIKNASRAIPNRFGLLFSRISPIISANMRQLDGRRTVEEHYAIEQGARDISRHFLFCH
jgi:putative glutamine amidotransferase